MFDIHNGCYITFTKSELDYLLTSDTPEWISTVYKWFLDDFADSNGELEMYVDW